MGLVSKAYGLIAVIPILNVPATEAQQPAGTTAATCRFMDECFAEWSCRLPPGVPRLDASATLTAGRYISGDLKGPYVEGRDSGNVYVRAALNIYITAPNVAATQAIRSLKIDLSHPADSIASSLGIIEDHFADFHAWGFTLAREGVEPTIQYMPVGSVEKSALVHIDFTYRGRYFLLQLGPEALGEGCNQGGTGLYGTGTTAATVSRPRYNRYVVDAPVGSIGRLFDITNKLAGAINKGLYYTSFRVVFDIH
jgi:hypothetical protein